MIDPLKDEKNVYIRAALQIESECLSTEVPGRKLKLSSTLTFDSVMNNSDIESDCSFHSVSTSCSC